MNRVSWLYINSTFGCAIALCFWVVTTTPQPVVPWLLFIALTLLTTFLAIWTVDVSSFQSFEGSTISIAAALFLLPPWLFIIHLIIAYSVNWLKEYWVDGKAARAWYLHVYNLANSLIGGACAYLIMHQNGFTVENSLTVSRFFQVIVMCATLVMLQELSFAGWLVFVRHVPWREINVWRDGLWFELPQACLGYLAAKMYQTEPLLALFTLAPIVLTYQASLLPKLQHEAMDALKHFAAELQEKNHAIQQRNEDLFVTLAKVFDARDPYVGGHAAQVAAYAVAVGEALNLTPERIEILRQSAYLHDIGKIAIPDAILHKPDRLTDSEYQIIKKHTDIGADFVETSAALKHLAPFIRYHHERWDGQGYPSGLSGEAIPLEARILNICDSVEAMASDRPYHRALSPTQIIDEVKKCAGHQFDPQVADAFIQITEHTGAHFVVNSARAVAKRHYDTRPNHSWSISRLAQVYGLVPS